MTPEEFILPRYKAIADYPNSPFDVGEIINVKPLSIYSVKYLSEYPHLFRKLEWWEGRTLDEMCSVKYVKVTEYVGYHRVGDIVPVVEYQIIEGTFRRFILKLNHPQKPSTVLPANEELYNDWKKQR